VIGVLALVLLAAVLAPWTTVTAQTSLPLENLGSSTSTSWCRICGQGHDFFTGIELFVDGGFAQV
jgi:hypothetical protein